LSLKGHQVTPKRVIDALGWNCQVMESWKAILRGVRPGAFKIEIEDVRIWANETAGFVTCVEVIDADDSQGR